MNFSNADVSEISVIKPREKVDNCQLLSVEKVKLPVQAVDQNQMHFTFIENSTGAKLVHKEFDPTTGDTSRMENNVRYAKSRITHILNRYVDNSTVSKLEAQGWEEYIDKSIQLLGDSYKGVTCSLKVTLKSNKYSALPNFPPFISTEKSPRDFSTNPKYDKYEMEEESPSQMGTTNVSQQGSANNGQSDGGSVF